MYLSSCISKKTKTLMTWITFRGSHLWVRGPMCLSPAFTSAFPFLRALPLGITFPVLATLPDLTKTSPCLTFLAVIVWTIPSWDILCHPTECSIVNDCEASPIHKVVGIQRD